MSKNELPVPVLAFGLAIAFSFVSLTVLLTRHPRWIERKLRVGALLLSLTAVVSCGDTVQCYAPVYEPENEFVLDADPDGNGIISVDLSQSRTLLGSINWRTGEAFSYRTTDSDGTELARDDIDALDGAYDEDVEEFEITLPATLTAGNYTLELFASDADAQPEYPSATFSLEVQ